MPGQISALLRDLVRAPVAEPRLGWGTILRPGLVVGRFELLHEIARGGFGIVYAARDRELGRVVAFKALQDGIRPSLLEDRLLLEAEAAARCSHPNIVTLFDVGTTEYGPYLVLELLQGQTLTERLRRGAMTGEEALRIGTEIAKGLAHAHAHGVIHRDLTPGNVFLCDDGQVKLLDLGMAHAFGRPVLQGGTPGYMAPEQRDGAPQDERTDVYALGAVLCRMLRDDRTAEGGRVPGAASRARRTERSLRTVIARMMDPDPAARPEHAGAALASLMEIGRTVPPKQHSRTRTAALAVVVLTGIVVAVLPGWLRRDGGSDENPLARARFAKVTDFDGVEQAAAISRDGRFVAFQSARDGQMDVWVTQVGTGRFANLTRGGASGIVNPSLRALGFTPDGALVTFWARKGNQISVWGAPLMGGPLREYLDGGAEYDWSPEGERLVYHTPGPGDPMYIREPGDRSPGRLIFSAPEGLHGHFPLWSPDQAFVYFVQGSPPDHLDVWRIPSAGGTPERLTQHDSVVTYPVFRDQRTLLYLARDEDGAGPWIYGLDVEKRATRRLSTGIETFTSLAASADGRRLVATAANPKGTLWRVPFDGVRLDMSLARRIPLTTGNGSTPRLGPGYLLYVTSNGAGDTLWKLVDGTATELWTAADTRIIAAPAIRRDGARIAVATSHRGQTQLRVVDAEGANARTVTSALLLRGAPAWTPDGSAITVAGIVDRVPRLFTIRVDGGATTPLLAEHSVDPVWSPRDDVLVFSGADVGTTFPVKAIRADGSPHRTAALRLTRGARHLAFLADGRSLLVLRGEIAHKNLWLVDLETGAERRVSDFPPDFDVEDFDVSSDGREVVLHQVQQHSDVVLLDLPRP